MVGFPTRMSKVKGNDRDMDGPLYSEVLRMGLDRDREEKNRKDGEQRSTS